MVGRRFSIMQHAVRKNAIAYCRLSKEDKDRGVGLESQQNSIMKYINEQGDVDLMPTGLEQDAQTQRDDGFFFEDFSGGTVTYRKIFFKILKNICKNLTYENWGAVCKGNCVAGALRPADVLIVYSMDS